MIGRTSIPGVMRRSLDGWLFTRLVERDRGLRIVFIMRLCTRVRVGLRGISLKIISRKSSWDSVLPLSLFPVFRNILTYIQAYNPKELSVLPATWCRTLGPIVYEAFNDSGGHFYATEKPALLARDLRAMFGKGGGAYKVVKGRTGYASGRLAKL
jgi:hypothetical protein